jgi:hypothetical protein
MEMVEPEFKINPGTLVALLGLINKFTARRIKRSATKMNAVFILV